MAEIVDTEDAIDFERASVRIEVSALRPVRRKCDVKFTASAEVFQDDTSLYGPIDGWTIRQDRGGRFRANQPAWRDPDSGEWKPVFRQIPRRLLQAIGEELLLSVPGGMLIHLSRSENAK